MMRRAGFTIIELVVVVALVSFLAAVSVVAVTGSVGAAHEANTRQKLERLGEGVERYTRDADALPADLLAIDDEYVASNYSAGADDSRRDVWGRDLVVATSASPKPAGWLPGEATLFEIRSPGPDGVASSGDDVVGRTDVTSELRRQRDARTEADLAALRDSISRYNRAFFDSGTLTLLKTSAGAEDLSRTSGVGLKLDNAGLWPKVRDSAGSLVDMLVTDGYGERYELTGQGASVRARSKVATWL